MPPLEDRLWKHVKHEDIAPTGNAAESDSDHEPTSTVTIPTPPRSADPDESKRVTADEESSLKRTPMSETSNLKVEKIKQEPEEVPEKTIPSPALPLSSSTKPVTVKEEPATAVAPPVAPMAWKGTVNMVDVAQISITAHIVSGDTCPLTNDLPANLDIVGRISPDTVWDYIMKMKCSNSKTISVLRLNATNMEEKMPYIALYSYLSSR